MSEFAEQVVAFIGACSVLVVSALVYMCVANWLFVLP